MIVQLFDFPRRKTGSTTLDWNLYHKRRRQQKQQRWRTGMTISIPLLALIASVIAWQNLQRERAVNDDLCLLASPPRHHVVIMLDATDRFTTAQYRNIVSVIQQQLANLSPGDRLSLVNLFPKGNKTVISPLFSKCRPETGGDRMNATVNPKHQKKVYQEKFMTPLNLALKAIPGLKRANTTPLLEALHELTIQYVSLHAGSQTEVILFSNMLNNTRYFSQYRHNYSFSQLKKRNLASVLDMKSAWRDVDVVVYQFSEPDFARYQDKRYTRFWTNYMQWAGVRSGNYTVKTI